MAVVLGKNEKGVGETPVRERRRWARRAARAKGAAEERTAPSRGSAGKLTPAGAKIVAAFEEATEAMRSGGPLIDRIAGRLGAEVVGPVPETGGGTFGAARLARIVASLQARLEPGRGKRAGRPSDASWALHPEIPISRATEQRLIRLAERASTGRRKVSPMQLAAQILEDALAGLPEP